MSRLKLENVSLTIEGNPILNGVTVDFWEAHIHALVGPNGAGKSTLASTIMGLEGYRGFEGDITLDGKSIRDASVDERARMGMTLAWQEPARFEGVPVRRFVAAGARDKSRKRIEAALEQVGLEPSRYINRAVDKTLSGGERKRIELASILTMEPAIVLMDEPDSGIDVAALDYIFEATRVLKEQGATVIQITHSMAVLKQSEHAFLMCHGKIIDKGDVGHIATYFENRCLPCSHINLPDSVEVAMADNTGNNGR